MPTTITHGHGSTPAAIGGDYMDEFKTSASVEVSERRGTNTAITKVKEFNPTTEVSIKGGGAPTVTLGVSTTFGITGGVTMVNKNDHTTVNSDFDSYEASGKNYPGAS